VAPKSDRILAQHALVHLEVREPDNAPANVKCLNDEFADQPWNTIRATWFCGQHKTNLVAVMLALIGGTTLTNAMYCTALIFRTPGYDAQLLASVLSCIIFYIALFMCSFGVSEGGAGHDYDITYNMLFIFLVNNILHMIS